MGELECFEVLATALPGRTLYIEQVMHTTKANCWYYCCQTRNFRVLVSLVLRGRIG